MSAAPRPEDWVAIGVVARPHGLRGGVLVKDLTGEPHGLVDVELEEVHLRRGREIRGPVAVKSIAPQGPLLLVKLEGTEDRTAAELLAGWELVIREDERWELEDGAYYADELVGMTGVDAKTGETLGEVLGVRDGPGYNYLVLTHPKKPGGELLIPFVASFVGEIDEDAGRIPITIVEGLLDI